MNYELSVHENMGAFVNCELSSRNFSRIREL
jgi:hypothetical protein